MLHGVLGCDPLSMIVAEHLAQKVESLLTYKARVLRVDELGPGFARERVLRQEVFVVRVKCQSVLVQVGVELLSAEDFGDLYELVVVIAALEEWLSLEDHSGEHAAEGPDV